MIRIDLILDEDVVMDILFRHWDVLTDDGNQQLTREFLFHAPRLFIGCWDDDEFLGMFMITMQNLIVGVADVLMLPNCGGLRALKAYKKSLEWVWQNTAFIRIISVTPSCNRLGLKFARLAGLLVFGVNPNAWLKNDVLYDLIYLGVTRGECGSLGSNNN